MEAFERKKAVWIPPLKKGVSINKVLVDSNGYRLHYKKKDTLKKYYHCDKIVAVKYSHNHDNDALEYEVKKVVRTDILKAVQNPSVCGRTVRKDISTGVLNSSAAAAGIYYIPSHKLLSVILSRKRNREKNFPPIPQKWNEIKIPSMLRKTADGQDYFIMDEKVPGSDCLAWGFASKAGLYVMNNNSQDWFMGVGVEANVTLYVQLDH